MFNLTEQQKAILEEFRAKVDDVLQTNSFFDFYLHRWLIVSSWNLQNAEKMLRQCAEWRRKNDIDNILETWKPPEVITKYVPGGFSGFDKDGSPVWIETWGRIDLKGLSASSKRSDIYRNRFYIIEKCDQLNRIQSEKANKYTGGCTMIYDFHNFGLKHLWKPGLDMTCEMIDLSENYFPEQLKKTYIIRAPKLFYVAFQVIKPFLHEESRKKVCILGGDWKEKLLEAIDADQLPVHWGGTMRDPDGDEFCRSKICIGGEIPERYYCKETYATEPSELTEISLNPGATHKVLLSVETPMSIIRWQFHTESHDIGFGIFRKTKDDEPQKVSAMEAVVDGRRVNSHMVPEEGSTVVEVPGQYVVRFFNTYSWINKKKLFYQIDVLLPDNELKNQSRVSRTDVQSS